MENDSIIRTIFNTMIVMKMMIIMMMMMMIPSCYPLQTILSPLLLLDHHHHHHHHHWMTQQQQEQLLRRDFIQQVTTIISTVGIASSSSSSSTTSSSTTSILPIANPAMSVNNNMIISDASSSLSSSTSSTLDSSTSTFMISKNLPDTYSSNNFQKFGTVETLYPIVQMKQSMITIQKQLSSFNSSLSKDISIKQALNQLYYNNIVLINKNKEQSSQFADAVSNTKSLLRIPINEVLFKRIFDDYSTPISYKQQYLNNNAFLVYYTKGYDGPNRPNIETYDDSIMKQTIQYGLRNDIWIQWDEFINELQYQILDNNDTNVQELMILLQQTIQILNQYLEQAPTDDVQICYNQLSIIP